MAPTYQISYERQDMSIICRALKTAHTEKEAVSCLCTGNKKKGYRLAKSGVSINITEIKELN